MADREVDFLLVGGGLAGASCASELRKQGAEGSILLAGREPEPPYERPPLSKEYLRGDAERAEAYVNQPSWYEENGVELLTGKNVMSIDAEAKTAKIQGGEEVAFGQALLATGANVNILRLEGAEIEGIHYLRGLRQRRRDPRGREGGGAGGPGRRLLHRRRGGGLAGGDGHALHDGDVRGRGALAHLRRRRRALLPGRAGRARRDLRRRRVGRAPTRATAGSARC